MVTATDTSPRSGRQTCDLNVRTRMTRDMRLKDFIEIHDWTAAEVMEIFELAKEIKAKPKKFRDALEGQTLAMIFEKSSTRTRVSFETGMFQLGGQALF